MLKQYDIEISQIYDRENWMVNSAQQNILLDKEFFFSIVKPY